MEQWQLQQRLNLPLFAKVRLTELRIRQWYEHWNGQVYVSFSGGKDSTVLLHLVRKLYPRVPALFIDSGLEYPEIRAFIKGFENVVWIRPKRTFGQIIERWGWPLISKSVAGYIYQCYKKPGFNNVASRKLRLTGRHTNGTFNYSYMIPKKWQWLIEAPFKISDRCCDDIKKKPAARYEKVSGRVTILGTLAVESIRRTQQYMKYGCNVPNAKRPHSMPMAFWTEQDVLQFIYQNSLSIAKVYGDIIQQVDGKLITTGCDRTGCMFCGFGVHLEKEPNRFQRMKITHPAHWRYCIEKLGMGEILSAIGVPFE